MIPTCHCHGFIGTDGRCILCGHNVATTDGSHTRPIAPTVAPPLGPAMQQLIAEIDAERKARVDTVARLWAFVAAWDAEQEARAAKRTHERDCAPCDSIDPIACQTGARLEQSRDDAVDATHAARRAIDVR